jgi:hypothetical protein
VSHVKTRSVEPHKTPKEATMPERALVEALELCLTGGNHIAGLLVDKLGPGFAERWPPDTDHEIALHSLHATDNYDLWCCWAAIMRARDLRDAALSQPQPLPREGDWVMVPREPTEAMLMAFDVTDAMGAGHSYWKAPYRAMLAASPPSPDLRGEVEADWERQYVYAEGRRAHWQHLAEVEHARAETLQAELAEAKGEIERLQERAVEARDAIIQRDYQLSRLVELLRTAEAQLERLQGQVERLLEAGKPLIDCWGIGTLNITAMTDFVAALAATHKEITGEGKADV